MRVGTSRFLGAAAWALFAAAVCAQPEPEKGLLLPPAAPAHARRQLDTAAELSRDLQETVSFLEEGQSYFRAYQKGTHQTRENEEFLKFMKAFERERETAKKESDALRRWVYDRSGL